MSRASIAPKPSDEEILSVLAACGGRTMTYVLGNVLRSAPGTFTTGKHKRAYKGISTAFIRRRMLALEKAGKVRRAPTSYAVMICWEIAA